MFFLALIVLPLLEIFVFIEVGLAIGWLWAIVLLIGTSLLGVRVLRTQGRAAVGHFSAAVSERRPPAGPAINTAIGFLGGALLVIPGFITDVLGGLLLLPPVRTLTRGWVSRHYLGRFVTFVAASGRFASRAPAPRPADVESTAVEDDLDALGR
jgi:UPF0716 protein FxsA